MRKISIWVNVHFRYYNFKIKLNAYGTGHFLWEFSQWVLIVSLFYHQLKYKYLITEQSVQVILNCTE